MSDFSKAIAGGIAGLLIALFARYGFAVDAGTANAIGVIVTAIVGYVIGHLAVYFAPANTNTTPTTGGTPSVG